jgi:hypothetical protein
VTNLCLESSFEVLFDALSVEDVVAFRLNCILCKFVAEATDHAFACLVRDKGVGIGFATDNQVRMASHLPHAGQSVAS